MPGNELVQSLGRGLDLLCLLARSDGGMRMPEIVKAAGLKQPTAHNLLRTLASRGFVANDGGIYRIGPTVHIVAAEAASGAFLKQAEEAVRHLGRLLPEAIVSFCEPVGGEVLVRFHLFPERSLMQRGEQVFDPYHSASGLAFLAYADPETRRSVQLRHPFELEGVRVWRNEAKLEKFLKEVRARGYVLPPSNTNAKFRVAARPNLSESGKLLGALGAAWHVAPNAKEDITEKVLAALKEASAVLNADSKGSRGSRKERGA
ncbi:MAG: helix-turn-helix domain-containing protein [Kiritimatiellae bacterium]|nr:helix-turn-helix domain-containing protein [Kiritimatiellia bacterium]